MARCLTVTECVNSQELVSDLVAACDACVEERPSEGPGCLGRGRKEAFTPSFPAYRR